MLIWSTILESAVQNFCPIHPKGAKTLRQDADGYYCGEGVGIVVLKRLEDAPTDDNILANIRRAGRNCSSDVSFLTHSSASVQDNSIQ